MRAASVDSSRTGGAARGAPALCMSSVVGEPAHDAALRNARGAECKQTIGGEMTGRELKS